MENNHNLQGMAQLFKTFKILQHAVVAFLHLDLQLSVIEETSWTGLHLLHLMLLFKLNSNLTFSNNLNT